MHIDALSVLCAQLTHNLLAIAKFLFKNSFNFVCKMFKLRKEKMEKNKNVLLQLSSNGSRMTGEIERQRLQSEKSEQLQLFSM